MRSNKGHPVTLQYDDNLDGYLTELEHSPEVSKGLKRTYAMSEEDFESVAEQEFELVDEVMDDDPTPKKKQKTKTAVREAVGAVRQYPECRQGEMVSWCLSVFIDYV